EPLIACQSDGSTTSAPGRRAAIPWRSTHDAAPRIDLIGGGVLVDLRLVDEDVSWLRAFIATDDASSLQHVDEAPGPRVADPQAALDQGHRRRLRLDDDLDRLVQQRIVIRVEV